MSKLADFIVYLTDCDYAVTSLLRQMRKLGDLPSITDNIDICRKAEALIAGQAARLKILKECSDKQLQWIKNAMDAIHPECDVTSDPESLKGKTLRLSQTAEIERLKEINNNLIEVNERISARVADWDEVCKVLWDRGYGQLDQPINETPLGSCLRLIAEGSPDPAKGQAGKFSGGYTVGVDMGVGELSKSATTILETVPLTGSDLPLGTAIRFPQNFAKEAMVLGRDIDLVWIAGHGGKGIFLKQLMNENAEYRLPGSDEWKPCHKLVNRSLKPDYATPPA